MKVCSIAILGFCKYPSHAGNAAILLEEFQQKRGSLERYKVAIYLLPEDSREYVQQYIKRNKVDERNLIISIGAELSILLHDLYRSREIKEVQTIFMGVTDPVGYGIVESLERPGACMSGVRESMPCPKKHAAALKALYPFIKKIFVPYDPSSLQGLLEDYASQFLGELEMEGFEIEALKVKNVEEVREAITSKISKIDAILLLPGCKIAVVEREVAYVCKMTERLFLSSAGQSGLRIGASFSYGSKSLSLIPAVREMADRFWGDRIPVGSQSVVTVPDNSKLFINRFILQIGIPPIGIPVRIFKQFMNDSNCVVECEWVDCPIAVGKEMVYEGDL